MRIHWAGLAALLGWAGLAWVSRTSVHPLIPFLLVQAGQWLIFLWVYRRIETVESRRAVWFMAAWAVGFRLCGWAAWPLMEDDHFRFLWDGWRLVVAGNPYAAAPADFFGDPAVPGALQAVLDQINYPHVPTIYGPVCQLLFGASHLIAPAELWAWKLCLLVFDLGLLALALALTLRRGGEEAAGAGLAPAVRTVLVLGWAPLMVFETSFNAHPDIVGVMFVVLALVCLRRQWLAVAGGALALAVGAKVFALLIVPFLLRRSGRGWVAFSVVLACLYLPFWLQGTTADLGGLLAYGQDWEFNSSIFGLGRWILGPEGARLLCGALFLAGWGWLLLRAEMGRGGSRESESMTLGLVVYGLFFLLSSTVNPWYLLWLAPFLLQRVPATALAAWALVSLSYITGLNTGATGLDNFEHPVWVRPLEYGGIGVVALWEWLRVRGAGVLLARDR